MKPAKTKKALKKGKSQKKRAAQKNDHIPVIRKNAQMFSEGFVSPASSEGKILKGSKSGKTIKAGVPNVNGPFFKMVVKSAAEQVEQKIAAKGRVQMIDAVRKVSQKIASDLKKTKAIIKRKKKSYDAFYRRRDLIAEKGRLAIGLTKKQYRALALGIPAEQSRAFQERERKRDAMRERRKTVKDNKNLVKKRK